MFHLFNLEKNLSKDASDEKKSSHFVESSILSADDSLFNEKVQTQLEEINILNEAGRLPHRALRYIQSASKNNDFNRIESILDEANINFIKEFVRENKEELESTRILNLPNCSLTRFPIEKILEDIQLKELFFKLETLNLNSNKLNGMISPEFGKLPKLRALILSKNQLRGPIPPELSELSELRYLDFSKNKLSGSIPFEFEMLFNLDSLKIKDNYLSGIVPGRLALKFPDIVNNEGQIANQRSLNDTTESARNRLKP